MTLLLFKSKNFILKIVLGDFPGYLVEEFTFKAGGCVFDPEVGELRSHMPGAAKPSAASRKPAGS